MIRHHGNRARFAGVLLVVVLGVAAVLALPGVALTKDRDSHGGPRAAGTIQSFDPETHLLVIDLTKAGTIEGLVVRRTRIRCGDVSRRRHRRHRRHRRLHASTSLRDDREIDRFRDREPGDDRGDDSETAEGGDEGRPDDEGKPDDHGSDRRHRRHRRGKRCVDALVEGATVMRAEMVLAHGKAFYKKIGVLPPPAASTE